MEQNQSTSPEQHVCGLCHSVFNSVEEYTAHTCPSTGFTPADPQHQGPDFAAVQQAALQRGAAAQTEQPIVEAAQADSELVQEQQG